MKTWLRAVSRLCLVSLLVVAAGGCKRSIESDSKLFQSAKPEVKAAWDGALAAAKTNDYAQAILTLQGLRQEAGLTPEQSQAIDNTVNAINDQLHEAATKGDANALQSLDVLRKARSR